MIPPPLPGVSSSYVVFGEWHLPTITMFLSTLEEAIVIETFRRERVTIHAEPRRDWTNKPPKKLGP